MIAKLNKINIIAPRQYQENILDILHSIGTAHIIQSSKFKVQSSKIESAVEKIDYQLSNIKFALSFLEKHNKDKQGLADKLSFSKKSLAYSQIKKEAANLDIERITSRIMEIEKNLEQGHAKYLDTEAKIKELQPWVNLTEKPQETEYVKMITGVISLNKYPAFIHQLERRAKEAAVETLFQGLKDVYLQIVFLKNNQSEVKTLLDEYKFEMRQPAAEGQPAAELYKLNQESRHLKNVLAKWQNYIHKFKKYIELLKMAEDFLTWKKAKLEARQRLQKTKFFITLKAWVKHNDIKNLRQALKKIGPDILIVSLKRKNNENPPVVIENNNFIAPFESVTGIYGLPRYNEIDPTPYLAPFFIVFFALCLTDAGYGLIMAAGSFLAIKLLKIPVKKQKLFRLLGYGGILTFVIGALFGGWFGIDISTMAPGPIKNFIEFFKVIDPMQDTVLFMLIAFALGILQMWFARIVKTISAFKNQAPKDAASGLAWAAFILIGIIWLVGVFLKQPLLTKIGLYTMILSIIGLIFTESQNTKNIFLKPLVGVIVIIQGLIGLMSDTLSYSRLMALGLATGIIAFIINTIAVIFRDLIPYAGWGVWVLILLGGHIFNLGINALGSFIHSGRLQFVEFFPKFMEGGGQRFVPFKRESKYFEIVD